METALIEMDRTQAALAYRKYREHRAWQKPIDQEIERLYSLIAKGKVVIRALESIRAAGANADGLPKLAICRADAKTCYLDLHTDGSAVMKVERWTNGNTARNKVYTFPEDTFPRGKPRYAAEAMVPLVPVEHRPKRGIENYAILWEAEWRKIPPVDPMLLRRIGKGDTWLVVAAWDLTEVERAVMADRAGRTGGFRL